MAEAPSPGESAATPAPTPLTPLTVPTASTDASAPFEALGGEPGVRGVVDAFYDLMELEPRFGALRAMHPTALEGSRDKLFWFLCGWLGGPRHYEDRFGHPMLRARHLPFPIGIRERDDWLGCMAQALTQRGVPDALQQRLMASFAGTADWMRNRAV